MLTALPRRPEPFSVTVHNTGREDLGVAVRKPLSGLVDWTGGHSQRKASGPPGKARVQIVVAEAGLEPATYGL